MDVKKTIVVILAVAALVFGLGANDGDPVRIGVVDLDQAVTVDTGANEVTFVPAISASFDPTNPKPIAATGFLVSVDVAGSRFEVENRTPAGQAIGRYTVMTTTTTIGTSGPIGSTSTGWTTMPSSIRSSSASGT